MSTPDRPVRYPAATAADDELPAVDLDQSDDRSSSTKGHPWTLRRLLVRHREPFLDVRDGASGPPDDVLGVLEGDERIAAVIDWAPRGKVALTPVADIDDSDTSVEAVGAAADAWSVADAETEPAPRQAGGFAIPLVTEEQVERRDALRARVDADLARREAARAS